MASIALVRASKSATWTLVLCLQTYFIKGTLIRGTKEETGCLLCHRLLPFVYYYFNPFLFPFFETNHLLFYHFLTEDSRPCSQPTRGLLEFLQASGAIRAVHCTFIFSGQEIRYSVPSSCTSVLIYSVN